MLCVEKIRIKQFQCLGEKDYVHIQEIIAGLNYLFCQLIGALGTKEDHS